MEEKKEIFLGKKYDMSFPRQLKDALDYLKSIQNM